DDDVDRLADPMIERDDGATPEFHQVGDRHDGRAEHDLDVDRDAQNGLEIRPRLCLSVSRRCAGTPAWTLGRAETVDVSRRERARSARGRVVTLAHVRNRASALPSP